MNKTVTIMCDEMWIICAGVGYVPVGEKHTLVFASEEDAQDYAKKNGITGKAHPYMVQHHAALMTRLKLLIESLEKGDAARAIEDAAKGKDLIDNYPVYGYNERLK